MRLPDSFLQELKDRNNILDVVSGYVNLKRSGRTMSGLCPFHGEKTPSFHVNAEQGYFHCFGCGAGGDVITFSRRTAGTRPPPVSGAGFTRLTGKLPDFSTGAFTVRKGKTLWPISGAGGLPSGPSNTSAWDTLLIPVTL